LEPWEDPDASDSALIIGSLFEISARLRDIEEHVVVVRALLEEEDDDDETEDDSLEP
jgi:hypothetical protein